MEKEEAVQRDGVPHSRAAQAVGEAASAERPANVTGATGSRVLL